MNLETALPPAMWDAIRNNYEKRDFTSAILDCCYFISDLIRQKSGLDGDGVPLIGQALGGMNPKIRIAKDQSETEQNIQKGIESILRGFYQAIRNPRSHKKITDTADDADSIILFYGYIVRQIEQARAPASKDELIKRILDKDFVPEQRYADLLVEEIPVRLRKEVFLGVYEQRSLWNSRAIINFNRSIMPQMTLEEQTSIIELISDDLKTTDDDAIIRNVISGFPPQVWENISEVARLRIENKIIRAISDGRYDRKSKHCLGGGLATWARNCFPLFLLKTRLLATLRGKFNSNNSQERDYALEYFVDILSKFQRNEVRAIESVFIRHLKEGIEVFHAAVIFSEWSDWSDQMNMAFKQFSANSDPSFDDEIPF